MKCRLCHVQCRNHECRDLIWLPPSSSIAQLQPVPDASAVGPVEILACPSCGHVGAYQTFAVLEVDSEILDAYSRRDLVLRLLEFDCTQDHCGCRVTIQSPLAFHLRDDVQRFLQEAKSWIFREVYCAKGHQIRNLPPEERCLTSLLSERWAHTPAVNREAPSDEGAVMRRLG